jgi:hypothetical protein
VGEAEDHTRQCLSAAVAIEEENKKKGRRGTVELGWARPKRRRREGDWAREEGRWAARGERGPRERGGFFFSVFI